MFSLRAIVADAGLWFFPPLQNRPCVRVNPVRSFPAIPPLVATRWRFLRFGVPIQKLTKRVVDAITSGDKTVIYYDSEFELNAGWNLEILQLELGDLGSIDVDIDRVSIGEHDEPASGLTAGEVACDDISTSPFEDAPAVFGPARIRRQFRALLQFLYCNPNRRSFEV